MRRVFMGAFLVAVVCTTQAQKLYRCGNNFSQVPCGPDAVVIKSQGVLQPPDKPAVPERVEAMKAACTDWLRRVPDWKDRDSVKIFNVRRGAMDVKTIDGYPVVVVSYIASVNGKNSYGAYIGEKPAVCYANQQETKILDGFAF